jgi:hypothetical protein
MTNSEYAKLYRQAIAKAGRINADTMKILREVYIEAGNLAAAQVAITEAAGLSDLTSTAWRQIENQLLAGADLISQATVREMPLATAKAYQNIFNIDAEYIADAVKAAGVTLISPAGISNMVIGVNFRLLQEQASRIYADGFSFSDRVWNTFGPDGKPIGLNGDYQYRIKNLILTGDAQGRDSVKIADDIQQYILKGKDFVFKEGRYGKLVPGTAEYKARISKKIDWRALRLVRSEMNASLQLAGIANGQINPGATDSYDWNKTHGNPIDPDPAKTANGKRCIDLDRDSPYTKEEIPVYNHPNCSCYVTPVLKPQREVVKDLKDWVPGDGSPIDNWYRNIYLPSQR